MLTLEQQKKLNINEFRIRTQNKDTINSRKSEGRENKELELQYTKQKLNITNKGRCWFGEELIPPTSIWPDSGPRKVTGPV